MRRFDAVIPVFDDAVWIEIEGETGHYAMMCSFHGPERSWLRPPRGASEMREYTILAWLITEACAARSAPEFRENVRTYGKKWRNDLDAATAGHDYAWIALWLRRTLGTCRTEIELSLERIARCDAPPPGYGVEDYWWKPLDPCHRAAALGGGAAALFCLPALLALTGTCAEYDVLARVFGRKSEEVLDRLVAGHPAGGLSPWKVAAECTRVFLEILRERHRYVL